MAVRSITNETFDEVYNFLRHKVDKGAAEGFKNSPNKLAWLEKYWDRLELDEDWTDKYKSMKDIVGDKSKTFPSLYEELNGTKPTEARFATIKKKYPWIVREELDEWFDKTNQYKDFYNEEATKEINKNLRIKEVKDWGLINSLLSSDYEKQRYIEDPQSAIFGEQAPGFVGSSAGAKGDLITGILAGAADAIPGKFATPIGPTIRLGRDVAHRTFDSPYKKERSQIAKDYLGDLLLNAGAYALANSKKLANIASHYSDEEVRTAFKLNQDRKNIQEGIKALDNSTANDLTSLMQDINALPESSLKRDLIEEAGDWTVNGIDPNRMSNIIESYNKAVNNEANIIDFYKDLINNPNYKAPRPNSYIQERLLAKPIKGFGQKLEYSLLKAADWRNLGAPGQMVEELSATAAGRGARPDIVETNEMKQEFEDSVERIKNNYGLLWSRNSKPEGYDNPIIKEAYNRWLKEQQ